MCGGRVVFLAAQPFGDVAKQSRRRADAFYGAFRLNRAESFYSLNQPRAGDGSGGEDEPVCLPFEQHVQDHRRTGA